MTQSPTDVRLDWLRPQRVAIAALVVGMVSAMQSFAMSRARSPSADLANALTVHLTFWVVWAALVPLVMRVSARIANAALPMAARLLCHVVVGTLLSVLNATVVYGMRMALGLIEPTTTLWREIAGFASWQLSADLLAYGLIAGGYHLGRSYARSRARETLEGRLREELAAARLAALRGQLHPHFLFNTLNSISALVDDDAAGARKAIALLGELLRRSLDATDQDWVTLGEEVHFAELYLAIESVRYGDRLAVACQVDDMLRHRTIPSFVLIPLVENAVKHGVARHRGQALVRLEALGENSSTVLRVSNTGAWRGDAVDGTGLARLRRRLEEIYVGAAQLNTRDTGMGEVQVEVRIPTGMPHRVRQSSVSADQTVK